MNQENIIWYLFMIPFCFIAGTVLIVGFFYIPNLFYLAMGILSASMGVFFIWLDKHYDLSSCEVVSN